ncbi:DUF3857 domain-containing protein [Bernardetia sp.]|uniref:DUF3857 domain-containing protein n=1 Tax=Bernardetia sp. TaxID=1937974 RepID=UPI0025C70C68|nr:DUF3857 domain-containing protein [Bernardetia sp.]
MTKNNLKVLFLPILYFGFVASLFSQNPEEIYNQYKKEFPDKMAVLLEKNDEIIIDFEDDTVATTHIEYEDLLFLTDRAVGLASQKAYESYFSKIEKIDALTLVPNGKRYKKMKVEYFKKEKESSSGIFYDDLESTNFIMPNVSPKARTQVEITQNIKDPRFLSSFYLDSYVPIKSARLTLKVHKDIEIAYKLFNTEDIKLDFQKSEKGNYIIYEWSAKNLADFKAEDNAPRRNYFSPHIVYYVTQINYPNRTQKLAKNVADLYDWYSNLSCRVNLEDDAELSKTVQGLIKDVESEEEKVRNIFYWVQDNIKYVAFEDGMRGFVPSEASFVYAKRYGDCKGMSSIIHKMLNMAGIENTYLTWIGSRDLPYKYSELPTPIVDNHMIVTYQNKEGEFIFLDATDSYSPFGFPSSMIQGKEALLGMGREEHKVALVPIINKEKNYSNESVELSISDKNLVGKGKYQAEGYPKGYMTHYIDGLSKENEQRYMSRYFTKGNNKFFVDDYAIKNLNEKDEALKIEYDFRIEDYAKFVGDEIYINMNMEKAFSNDEIDTEERKAPIENDYLYQTNNSTFLKIPEGYEIEYLPENSSFKNDLFGYEIKYEKLEGKVKFTHNYYKNYLLLNNESFEDWNKMIKEVNKAYREVIILKKK